MERTHFEGITSKRNNEVGFEGSVPPKKYNSNLAFEVAEFAKKNGVFDEFRLSVFDAYWINHLNISQVDVIVELASNIGLNRNSVNSIIKNHFYRRIIKKSIRDLNMSGGVVALPTFKYGNYFVHGLPPNIDVLYRLITLGSKT